MTTDERQVALISGAGRGIGLAIAARLAADGVQIVMLDMPDVAPDACLAAVAAAGGACLAIAGDVTLASDWRRAVAAALEHFGRLDIVVNNAGISGAVASVLEYPEQTFDRVMAVNVRGVFLGIKYGGAAMGERGGAIVNIASVSGLSGSRSIAAYTASKHAVIGLTKVAALDLAPRKIRVNAVCPAPTATQMVADLETTLAPSNPEAVRQRLWDSIPLGRYGEPGEIAEAVAFLAGPRAAFITGAALTVDGGMLAS